MSAAMLAAVIASTMSAAAPRMPLPRTVVDYYLLLPHRYFDIDRRSLLSPKYGGIVDINNGYLHTWSDGAQVQLDVCLFKRTDHSYLVAISGNYGNDAPGDWGPFLDLYAYRKGCLVDVTKAALPQGFNENLEYELPRYGTTIHGVSMAGDPICDLIWKGGRFQVRRRAPRGLH